MNLPPEQIGAVPQAGVNPAKPQEPNLSPEDLDFFRHDPEIIQAVSKFIGRNVTLEHVPDQMLIQIAGMVQKLGVDGAVQMARQKMPPDIQQKLRSAV